MNKNCAETYFYKKKPGTSGVGGQLYETKLLSLVLFRALEDEGIGEFYLGSNILIGDFDDVCIKWKRNGKDTVVFIQLKHKENINKSPDFNLVTYFESYKKVKNSFNIESNDILFKGDIANTDFYLVFYTASNNVIANKYRTKNNYSSMLWLEKQICAGDGKGEIFQISDIDYLMELKKDAVIDSLGEALAVNLVKNNEKFYANMLKCEHCNGLFRRYHVVLAEKVINVSTDVEEKDSKKFRLGSFRNDFFTSTDAVLTRLRMKFFEKLDEADRKEILFKTFTFKLPHSFGNFDLFVRKTKRIKVLADVFKELFQNYSSTKIITVDKDFCDKNKLNEGFLSLNGGLESLMGNLLIYDGETDMLKFNDKLEPRHINAGKLLIELNKNTDLFIYRFDIQLDNFTLCSLDSNKQERKLAKEYLNSLWCFTGQATENEVGDTLKQEIEAKYNKEIRNLYYPTIQSDAIYLKFHDAVQKWWMRLDEVEYLDQTCKYYEKSKTEIVDMLASLHFVYVSKLINSSIEFKPEAIPDFGYENNNRIIIINTIDSFLTAIKIYQSFRKSNIIDVIFLDIEYIVKKR